MKTSADYAVLEAEVRQEFPDFRVVNKGDSWLMKTINMLLMIITLGQMKTFMTSFITTLGTTMYVHSGWSADSIESQMVILRHERVHMRQSRRYGQIVFSLMYALLPLPTCLAYCRCRFEQEAYEESLKAKQEYYGDSILSDDSTKTRMIGHFTSAEYFWTWPWKSSVSEWYDNIITKLLSK